jgi:hypothetical protein
MSDVTAYALADDSTPKSQAVGQLYIGRLPDRSIPPAAWRLGTRIAAAPVAVSSSWFPGRRRAGKEHNMLVALIIILLVLAVIGGVAVNPLLFLIGLLALLVFFGGRRGSAV